MRGRAPLTPVYLVTGISGQLGRAVAQLLGELRLPHRGVDRLAYSGPAPSLICDLADPGSSPALRAFCRPVTHVIHLASGPAESKDLAESYASQFRAEVLGTLNVLRALPAGVRHVAYSSSMSVYGVPERLPVAEDHPLKPHSVHAVCKVAAERQLAEFSRTRHIPAAALRIASLYGPGGRGRAVDTMILRALRGEPPEVYGDGKAQRDYIYVDDAARAVVQASLREIGGPLNVGTGRGTSSRELGEAIARLAGVAGGPRLVEQTLDPQSAASVVFDIRRLSSATAFSPRVPLEEGLARTIDWVRRSLQHPV